MHWNILTVAHSAVRTHVVACTLVPDALSWSNPVLPQVNTRSILPTLRQPSETSFSSGSDGFAIVGTITDSSTLKGR